MGEQQRLPIPVGRHGEGELGPAQGSADDLASVGAGATGDGGRPGRGRLRGPGAGVLAMRGKASQQGDGCRKGR